ncbi:hypothetical protein ACQUSR_26975 [Streptomyces sp. P1-3]|uniref:hypothetical protein n=1 Tax=Streptomyces sp. P1-3 TaxID=3421658 RepID=UPI003D369242
MRVSFRAARGARSSADRRHPERTLTVPHVSRSGGGGTGPLITGLVRAQSADGPCRVAARPRVALPPAAARPRADALPLAVARPFAERGEADAP